MSDALPTFRRPSPDWCEKTAVRLLRIGTNEPGHADSLIDHEIGLEFVRLAARLDAYGQELRKRRRA